MYYYVITEKNKAIQTMIKLLIKNLYAFTITNVIKIIAITYNVSIWIMGILCYFVASKTSFDILPTGKNI